MADKEKVVDIKKQRDAFDKEMTDEMDAVFKKISSIEEKIAGLTQEKAAEWQKLKAHGFNKTALEAALKRSKMSTDQENVYDHSYVFARQVLNKPLPPTLLAGSITAAFLRAENSESKISTG